jgi:dienelactone hydrolase
MRFRGFTVASLGVLLLLAADAGGVERGRSSAGETGGAVSVTVSPRVSLEDQRLDIVVRGLSAKQHVTIGLRSVDARGVRWTSSASFVAGADGVVDVARSAAQAGGYTGVWAMGLVSALRPVAAVAAPTLYFWRRASPLSFSVSVMSAGHVLAHGRFERGISRIPLRTRTLTPARNGFFGIYFAPRITSGRVGAVLSFGGSAGGIDTLLAGALAAHGYASLALAYFKEPGLPQTLQRIPLEYFVRAIRWLRHQPGVDPSAITVLGISRGSEAALLLGADFPTLVRAVVAAVPSDVALCGTTAVPVCAGPAWILNARPVPYTTQFDNPTPTDVPAAVIPVERIRGPVFLACAGNDQVWASCPYAQAIVARLDLHHIPYHHVLVDAPDAGHGVGSLVPDEPGWAALDPYFAADAKARESLWPRLLTFLHSVRANAAP